MRRILRTSIAFVKKLFIYFVCCSTPRAIVDAVNDAANAEEFDRALYSAAGFEERRELCGQAHRVS